MIGDWVKHSIVGKIGKVYRICGNEYIAFIDGDTQSELVEPIQLTPEILEKNGFENIDNKYPFPTFRCDDKENYLCITIGFPEGDKTKRKRTFIEIDGIHIYIGHLIINFVHELQHTLKLCGIDKEIVV